MICNSCGKTNPEGSKFCKHCGSAITAAPAPAAAPAASFSLSSIGDAVKKYMHLIIVAMTVFALILAILNLFNTYEIPATVSFDGESETNYGDVADLFESDDDGKYALALIGNVLMGVASLVIVIVGALYTLKKFNNTGLYDQFVAKIVKGSDPFFFIGIVGAVVALIQIIFYACCTQTAEFFGEKLTASIGVHWTTWVALVLYGLMAAADKFLLNKKAAVPAPQPEAPEA